MDKKVIVDCHVHVTPDGGWFGTHINASLDRFLKELDASSVQKALLLPVGKDDTELREATEFVVDCTPISDMPLEKIRPLAYRELAAKFPSLKIILAHSGMPFIWETYLVLKWYNNIFADLSHILLYFQNTSLISDLAWVLRKIPQKFIYGSDFPEVGLSEYFQEFEKFCRHHHVPSEIILSNFNTVIRQSL
jgi:predicted TIM-barrel fold metal-dependent hydrolase